MPANRPVILHILPYLEQGGTERQPLYLMAALRDKYRFLVLAPPGPLAEEFRQVAEKLVHFPRMDHHPISGLREFKRALTRIINEDHPRLIQVHAAVELLWLVHQVAPDLLVLFVCHGYLGPSTALDYRLGALGGKRWADKVVGVSQWVSERLIDSGLPSNKVMTIYNGVPDTLQPLTNRKNKENVFLLGVVARLEPPKGVHDLIRSVGELKRRGLNVRLEIAGDGSQRSHLSRLAADLGLQQEVRFWGFLPPAERNEMLQRINVFVLPSYQEPFGLVCAEAMAAGRAVVATRVGGVPEIVVDGETGLLVPPGDWRALAEAIAKLVHDPETCRRMGEAGRRRYEAMFSVEKMAARYHQLYQEMLQRDRLN